MAKINKDEYEILKGLDDEWKWIARDGECNSLNVFLVKPFKVHSQWDYMDVGYKHTALTKEENKMFQFSQWEDAEPRNIAELIEEYEFEQEILARRESILKGEPTVPYEIPETINLDASEIAGNASDYKHFYKRVGGSEEKEVSFKEELKQEVEKIMSVTNYDGGWTVKKLVDVDKLFDLIDQLDEPTLSKKVQLSQTAAVELNRYKNRGYSLKDLLVIAGSKQAQEKLARAWLDGYTVDEEQKYYVLGKYDTPILFRDYKSRITESSNLSDIYPKANSEDFEFTEQEIKDYDERYIPFMVPVEEMEG